MSLATEKKSPGEDYIRAVSQFADRALEEGGDRYGGQRTPLLADGIDTRAGEPFRWKSGGREWILCNPANQQNLYRTLDGLSSLTGNRKYGEAAREAMDHAFAHLRYGRLFSWGGHMAYDLNRRISVHAADKGRKHELKCHYPYYELMWDVTPAETLAYIDALWESHVVNWDNLEFSRHGEPVIPSAGSRIWNRPYAHEPVFFRGVGLTFINAGSDLYYAAAMRFLFSGDEEPLLWAKRLAGRYAETRHPSTGLGGYQFSLSILPGPNGRGDRAIDQFGEQLREHRPIEATLSVARQIFTIAGTSAICRMTLADALGERGREFGQWAVEDLLAYGEHAYDDADHSFHPILTNGTRLTGLVMEKSGYYGKAGDTLKAAPAGALMLWSYAMGYRQTKDRRLWRTAGSIARGLGLGAIGESPDGQPALAVNGGFSHPMGIFAMLELYRATGHPAYLTAAVRIGDNILEQRFHRGYFLPGVSHIYAKLDAIEPLALLHLAAALRGKTESVPAYPAGSAFFSAPFDGFGHQTDNSFIYSRTEPLA